MATTIDVVLADKSPLVVRGLQQLFAEDDRFRLLATASDGERFLEAVDRLAFEVGVIGWMMPYCDGRGVLEALRTRKAAPRIVVHTGSIDPTVPRQVMALGGAGFCSKRDPPERLLEVMAAVAAGQMVFPFVDVRSLDADPLAVLTQRERELLHALSTGRSNAQLAKDLGISLHTVKFHLRHVFDKLGVQSRSQAVALYLSSREAGGALREVDAGPRPKD